MKGPLTNDQVQEIFILRAKEETLRVIASKLEISHEAVAQVLARVLHPDVEISPEVLIMSARCRKDPQEMIRAAKKSQAFMAYEDGHRQVDIAKQLGVTQATISRWLNGK